jgi:hypothetical protein
VFDRRIAVVVVPERKARTAALVGAVERLDDRPDEGGFAGAERSRERDDVTRTKTAGEGCGKCAEVFFGGKSQAQRGGPERRRRASFMSAGDY